MTDITHTSLEAALLDQHVAGAFHGKRYAFVATLGEGWQLGVAVEGQQGYSPISKTFKTGREAREWADGLNEHIGLAKYDIASIVISTMGKRRVARA